jgi:hypothetical protein
MMRLYMTKSSKPSKSIFSPETEEQVKDIISRTVEFKKVTESILLPYKTSIEIDKASQLVESVLERFPVVVREIGRRHGNRPSFEIRDEYDVQDFLRGLLRIFFDDIRDEEWTPSYAGASARMDLLLKNEQIVIEVKMARRGLGEKQIREQLIIDKAYYKQHKDCKKLYCFIYDPEGRIKNPRGFEKDLSDRIVDFETKVLIVPR